MNLRLPCGLALVGVCLIAEMADATSVMSPPTELITSPSSVYWTTLVTTTPRLVCAWPLNARSAVLRVTGGGFETVQERSFTRTAAEAFLEIGDLTFEAPSRFADECLYTLSIAFDSGESFTSRLASVCGTGGSGTRVIAVENATATPVWRNVPRHALIPILDKGVETVGRNGEEFPANLGGACGWYEWTAMPLGENVFTAGERTTTFFCLPDGTIILFR